jgi:catechol 2,3-dioxygenase-like lactoylglutathione lyase family enzyme
MKLGHIEIFVTDPLQSKTFYEDVLGLEVVAVQAEKFVWLKSGDMEILLRPGKNPAAVELYQEAPTALVFYTDNLTETPEKLKSRGLVFKGTDGSDTCLTFTDPDGNWFQLAQPN